MRCVETVWELTRALAPARILFRAKKLGHRDVQERALRMLYRLGSLETQ